MSFDFLLSQSVTVDPSVPGNAHGHIYFKAAGCMGPQSLMTSLSLRT
jgi:hypothetical protein